ncbi:hypothetical protein COEREDRAFT_10317 [Coemansia reversa NRRL 1564]|uniref:Uncharacterized protein n=1 Tax=Coemansia reversa (strain ATCC 12441 / NRRL 1564) TaxID=763665 RepID=A0A2G5B5Z2_COERN|nr:hypothetical protein COEREDRAFT_10317 [Coemansia reversa NRRL 1564]|eukprot:PIA14419.1 hypothetical protein COEREDRAFT_10317 [Coemansia reversa NRRL 1564]
MPIPSRQGGCKSTLISVETATDEETQWAGDGAESPSWYSRWIACMAKHDTTTKGQDAPKLPRHHQIAYSTTGCSGFVTLRAPSAGKQPSKKTHRIFIRHAATLWIVAVPGFLIEPMMGAIAFGHRH